MASANAAHTDHTDHTAHASHHPMPMMYLSVFGALLLLLLLTVGAYYVDAEKFIHFKGLNLIIAMVIAVAKAALVVLFFMNVRGSTKLTWLWASLGFLWLLLLGGILLDYQSRAWVEPVGWQTTPYSAH